MKSIFFTGKGGVGKSTLAASAAWQLSEEGGQVLLVSFDPAHNLGDIFNLDLGHQKHRYTQNLFLQEIDLEKGAQDHLRAHLDLLNETYGYMKALNLDKYFKVFKYSPGLEEYAALVCLENVFAREQGFDFIVFDTPPTGLTLRILALPQVTCQWLGHLAGLRQNILEKRHTVHNITGKYDAQGKKLIYAEDRDPVLQKIREMRARYQRVDDRLQEEDNMIALVFNPDFLSLRESRRLLDGLRELALAPAVAFHNKVNPAEPERAENIEKQLLGENPGLKLRRIPDQATGAKNNYRVNVTVSDMFHAS